MEYSQNESTANVMLARNAARKCHKTFKLTFPVQVQKMLEDHFEFTILEIELDEQISALVDLDNKFIGVNSNHAPNRKRFTLAHELGHIYLKHKDNRYNEMDSNQEGKAPYEKEADEFAAELLIPNHELKRVKTMGISDMQQHFQVSKDALFVQLLKYRLI